MKKKVIVVAGGNSGIGKSLIEELIEQNYKIHNLDLKIDASFPSVQNHSVNLNDKLALATVLEKIYKTDGEIDGLAAIAGIGYTTKFKELNPDHFSEQVKSNLDIIYNLLFTSVPYLNKSSASIVTVSSISSYGFQGMSAGYAAAKAGVIGLTKSLAVELAETHLRINCIIPGPIETPLAEGLSTAMERKMLKQLTPMKKLGNPKDVVKGILFFLQDTSSHITGQSLVIDGGLSLAYRPLLY